VEIILITVVLVACLISPVIWVTNIKEVKMYAMFPIIVRNSLVVTNIETCQWNRILKSYGDEYCGDKHLYLTVTCYVTWNAFTMKRGPIDYLHIPHAIYPL